jgi:5'-nucleotidase
VFTEGTDAQVVVVELDALIAYFKKHSPVSPPALGRITRVDQPETGARGR